MEGMSGGRLPFKWLDRRLRTPSASSFPIVLKGMAPNRPKPGRWMETTLVPLSLQVIPNQEVQIEVL